MKTCDHAFIDDNRCAKCGMSGLALVREELSQSRVYLVREREEHRADIAKLDEALEEAVALLRDWEDFEPGDPESSWLKRREEFLSLHEGRQ